MHRGGGNPKGRDPKDDSLKSLKNVMKLRKFYPWDREGAC